MHNKQKQEYGGESPYALGEATEEVSLKALIDKNNAAAAVGGAEEAGSAK